MYTNFFDDKIKTYRHTNTHTHASIIHGSLSLYEKKEKKNLLPCIPKNKLAFGRIKKTFCSQINRSIESDIVISGHHYRHIAIYIFLC